MPIQSRPMGQKGTDIILTKEARKLFPFSVECKNCETWHIQKDIEQAMYNTYDNTEWLLVYKRNGSKPVVVMDAEVFFERIANDS
jgi:hypothetical protein